MPRRLASLACLAIALAAAAVVWLTLGGGGRVAAAAVGRLGLEPVRFERSAQGGGRATVESVGGLSSALKAARSGDTIRLAPGSYTGLLIEGVSFPGGVTIVSADPKTPAALVNFNVVNSQGLRFADLELVARPPARFAFQVNKSRDIRFDRISLHGSLDGDSSNDANGLQIMGSSNVSVTNSEFQQLGRALGVSASSEVTLAKNHIHDVRTDGVDLAEVNKIQVVDNVFRNFSPVKGDHPDAIQFWTRGTANPSRDIVISGNVILRGEGGAAQGIFMGDDVGTLPFERVTISNNLIVGTGYNAIRVNGVKGLTLSGNELVSNPGKENRTFLLIQKADGVKASKNKAVAIGFDRVTNLTEDGNVTTKAVEDQGARALRTWGAAHPEAAKHLTPAPPGDAAP